MLAGALHVCCRKRRWVGGRVGGPQCACPLLRLADARLLTCPLPCLPARLPAFLPAHSADPEEASQAHRAARALRASGQPAGAALLLTGGKPAQPRSRCCPPNCRIACLPACLPPCLPPCLPAWDAWVGCGFGFVLANAARRLLGAADLAARRCPCPLCLHSAGGARHGAVG